jgi:hypothetical protein
VSSVWREATTRPSAGEVAPDAGNVSVSSSRAARFEPSVVLTRSRPSKAASASVHEPSGASQRVAARSAVAP